MPLTKVDRIAEVETIGRAGLLLTIRSPFAVCVNRSPFVGAALVVAVVVRHSANIVAGVSRKSIEARKTSMAVDRRPSLAVPSRRSGIIHTTPFLFSLSLFLFSFRSFAEGRYNQSHSVLSLIRFHQGMKWVSCRLWRYRLKWLIGRMSKHIDPTIPLNLKPITMIIAIFSIRDRHDPIMPSMVTIDFYRECQILSIISHASRRPLL